MTNVNITNAERIADQASIELEKATELHQRTTATAEEFTAALQKLLADPTSDGLAYGAAKADSELANQRTELALAQLRKAEDAAKRAAVEVRVQSLIHNPSVLDDAAVNAAVAEASLAVAVALRKLSKKLEDGNAANVEALAESRELDKLGAIRPPLQIVGGVTSTEERLAINGRQLGNVNITRRLDEAAELGSTTAKDEYLAPAREARIAKEKADSERQARWAQGARDYEERNGSRIDLAAL